MKGDKHEKHVENLQEFVTNRKSFVTPMNRPSHMSKPSVNNQTRTLPTDRPTPSDLEALRDRLGTIR